MSTNGTINRTAVRQLVVGDGTPEDRALQVLPTDRLEIDNDTLRASHPDVLQILRSRRIALL